MSTIDFVKDPPPEGVKRDLSGIKKATKWQSKQFNKQCEETTKEFNLIDIREYSPEAVALFNKSLELVIKFLKRIGINIEDLGVKSFNVFIARAGEIRNFYDSIADRIIISEKVLGDEKMAIDNMVHEIYHNLSVHAISLAQFQQEDKRYISKIKVGFSSEYYLIEKKFRHNIIEDKQLFVAINEGMTELLTVMTVPKEQRISFGYSSEATIVHSLIKNIYGESGEDVKNFYNSYFTGRIMFLRRVEKFYGKNSLKLLAHLNVERYYKEGYGHHEESLKKVLQWRDKVVEFFTTDDVLKREKLRKELKLDEL